MIAHLQINKSNQIFTYDKNYEEKVLLWEVNSLDIPLAE